MGGFTTDFETGLLDDFDFTITEARFAFDAKYNNGETMMLQLEGTTDNVDVPTTHLWFNTGKGWVSKDGGQSIVHESGKADKYFNRGSLIARLITRCIDDFNIGDLLNERGEPTQAKVWVGLKFHINNEVIDYGTGIEARPKAMPTAFIGVVGDAPVTATETPAQKIARAKAAKGSGGDLKSKVMTTLQQHDTFEAGQAAALEIDGVTDDDELLNGLMSDDGLWAESRA